MEMNRFLFCGNGENNEFISENWKESVEGIPFNIKGIRNETDSFLKGILTNCVISFTTQVLHEHYLIKKYIKIRF